jgi:hypothetical protein
VVEQSYNPKYLDHLHLRPVQAERKKREGGRKGGRGRERVCHRRGGKKETERERERREREEKERERE